MLQTILQTTARSGAAGEDFLTGGKLAYLPTVDAIVEHVGQSGQPGDVVCVFSNGGFGGIHGEPLAKCGGVRRR